MTKLMSNRYCVVIVAGGTGSRMKSDKPKQFIDLCGKSVLCHTIEKFENFDAVESIVLVAGADYTDFVKETCNLMGYKKITAVVCGGDTRQKSVLNGLVAVPDDCNCVLIHDAARPLVDGDILSRCVDSLEKGENCAAGVKVKDTLKLCDKNGNILKTPDREYMYKIQTPQCFFKADILKAHEIAAEKSFNATDDCMLLENAGVNVKIIEGSGENIKITTPEDLIIAEIILKKRGLI